MGTFILWVLAIIGVIALLSAYGNYVQENAHQQTLAQFNRQNQEIDRRVAKLQENKHLLVDSKLVTIFFQTYKDKFGEKRFSEIASEYKNRIDIQRELTKLKTTYTFPIDFRYFLAIGRDTYSEPENDCLIVLLIYSDWAILKNYDVVPKVKSKIVQDIIEFYDPEEPISVFNMYYIRIQKLLEIN